MRMLVALAFVVLLGSAASAQTIQGGFPTGTLWVSNNLPVGGESITIFTVIHNGTGAAIKGTVAFLVDNRSIGTNIFDLKESASSVQSVSWRAEIGDHILTAKIQHAADSGGKEVMLSNTETPSLTVTVAPPPPTVVEETLEKATGATEAFLASTPAAQHVVSAIGSVLEPVRKKGQEYFEQKVAERSNVRGFAPEGVALGTSTTGVESSNKSWLDAAKNIFYGTGKAIFSSTAYFYPLFALLFFFLLWRAIRWALRRPEVR